MNFSQLPFVSENLFKRRNISLPDKRAFAFRYKNIYQKISPQLVIKRKRTILSGKGQDIISLGGDTGEKEVFSILPNKIEQNDPLDVFIYDIRNNIPKEFIENKKLFPGISSHYITNCNLENFSFPSRHINNTRLCNLIAVLDYLKPEEGTKLLRNIKDILKPQYLFLGLWLASPDISIDRNPYVRQEIDEMKILLTCVGQSQVKNSKSISWEEFKKTSTFSLGWTKEEIKSYNLFDDYPGTSYFPIPIVRYFISDYALISLNSYRVSNSPFPREIFFLFERKK